MSRPAAARFRLGRFSLRARLTALLVGLLLLACAGVGVVTLIALRSSLINRLDQQLDDAGARYAAAVEQSEPPDGDSGSDRELGAGNSAETSTVGQATGTLGARTINHLITGAGVVTDREHPNQLTDDDRTVLSALRVSSRKQDVYFPGLGEYRVLVAAGDDNDAIITGLPIRGVSETVHRAVVDELVAFTGVVAIMGFIGTFAVRRSLRPLDRVAATALQVSELPLSSGRPELTERVPVADQHTEVGQVATAVNHMLDRIGAALTERQRSEDRLRQFLADASHELRTPLAVVRSHSELIGRQATGLTPEVSRSLGRIESAAGRMSRLVDDLLLLARLDSGQALQHEQVDLSRLAVEAVADARITGPQQRWSLDLPDHPVTVRGDEYRLQQVIVNLLSNARMHTPPGTRVRLSIAELDDAVELLVHDDGPGFPAGLAERAHERFVRGATRRASDSGADSSGGSGLGLAIAHSVVTAHRGSIQIDSEPGDTTIRIRLPRG
ncbi:MAG TPA: HAMP domain-containing sensor histidine kinase [Jatrophihabitans sp.]|nr:HAMP domain-containing sensor histidine kinase [Jatrophihabitans sp.]